MLPFKKRRTWYIELLFSILHHTEQILFGLFIFKGFLVISIWRNGGRTCFLTLAKFSATIVKCRHLLLYCFDVLWWLFSLLFLPSMCFLLFLWCVYFLRYFVCLIIVMSCTFDTTFKELVASSKTLRLSSR